ncbi:MAG TPA: hypothetical protein VIC26_12720 [Marinagarivorans sp.]
MDFSGLTMVDLAGLVANHLSVHNIDVVLVGGLAVEIYSHNLYLTKDIDMVNINYTPAKALQQAMAEIGFYKQGRVYINETTDISIEFPSSPLSVGDEIITKTTTVPSGKGTVPILTVNDVVKDRLAAFIHWGDNQSLVQATAVMLKHGLGPNEFKTYIQREGTLDHFALLESLHKTADSTHITMLGLEKNLTDLIIQQL